MKGTFIALLILAHATFALAEGTKPSDVVASDPGDVLKKIESTEIRIQSLQQQILAHQRLSYNVGLSGSRPYVGNQRDKYRAERALKLAAEYLKINEPRRALELVQEDTRTAGEYNTKEAATAKRIEFESLRRLGMHVSAARLCNDLLGRVLKKENGTEFDFARDDQWTLSCSLSFTRATLPSNKSLESITQSEFDNFAYTPLLRYQSQYLLPRAIVIAAGFKNMRRLEEGYRYLIDSMERASKDDPWRQRARLSAALLLTDLKRYPEAVVIFRELAGDLGSNGADKHTAYLAKMSLARTAYVEGKLSAARKWYERVLSDKDAAKEVAGKSQFYPTPEQHADFSLLRARSEYANVLYMLGDFKHSATEYEGVVSQIAADKSHSGKMLEPSLLNYAKILSKSVQGADVKGSQTAEELFKTLLGYAEADLNFVASQKQSASTADPFADAKALDSIAKNYHGSFPELERLLLFRYSQENSREKIAERKTLLMGLLNVVPVSSEKHLETQEYATLLRLLDLQKHLEGEFAVLDSISLELWKEKGLDLNPAQSHRRELLRRLDAINDVVTQITLFQRQPAFAEKNITLTRDVTKLRSTVSENKVTLNSVLVAKRLWQEKSTQEPNKTEAEKDLAALRQKLEDQFSRAESIAIEQRIFALSTSELWNGLNEFQKRYVVTSATMRNLFLLHHRMRRPAMGHSDSLFYSSVERAWGRAFEAQLTLLKAVEGLVDVIRQRRRYLEQEVLLVARSIETELRAVKAMQPIMEREVNRLSPKVAQKLEPIVRTYRDHIKVALADDDVRKIKEDEEKLNEVLKARKERESWIRSLRESVDFGLAR